MIRILTFSTLFPNLKQPHHGVFVETRLRHLVESGKVDASVVAPVPWFPFRHPRFGTYSHYSAIPAEETRHGLRIRHPRYPVIPKIGMTIAPLLLAQAMKPVIGKILDENDIDLIDAHYFYPDGVAALKLGRYFNKPVVITARGTDINLIPQHNLPRKMILWAAKNAAASITVCEALKTEMVAMGASAEHIHPIRNGVDLDLFQPIDRDTQRAAFGLDQFTLLSVGLLQPRKAHDLVIGALPMLPDVRLYIAGDGPERNNLNALAASLGVTDRVTFLGSVSQSGLRQYYGAADALVLASSREGWANVLLESMACGTPVIASNVWGTPEVVREHAAGLLLKERTAASIADAVTALRANPPARTATRQYAEQFSWAETTDKQIALFNRVLERRA